MLSRQIQQAGICVDSVTHSYSYCWVNNDGRCKSLVSSLTEIKYSTQAYRKTRKTNFTPKEIHLTKIWMCERVKTGM